MMLAILAMIFGGLFCLVGIADKNAHPIFRFWSFIVFGGGFGAIFLCFIWIAFPFRPKIVESLVIIGFFSGGLLGSFLGWRYAVRLKNKRAREV